MHVIVITPKDQKQIHHRTPLLWFGQCKYETFVKEGLLVKWTVCW